MKRAHCSARHARLHFVEIARRAGGEIVEPDDTLIEREQRFEQVRADEAGHAGDQPVAWLGGEFLAEAFVGGHGAWRKNHEAPAGASRNCRPPVRRRLVGRVKGRQPPAP